MLKARSLIAIKNLLEREAVLGFVLLPKGVACIGATSASSDRILAASRLGDEQSG